MAPSTPTRAAATLLFCHGGGFCGEIWSPIVRRLQRTPLLQRVPTTTRQFDFPYHGNRRNVSEPAILHLENPQSPRVTHPAMHWIDWATVEVQRQVAELRAVDARDDRDRTPLIGIGHSMGGAALWATEVANPGTFDGLVLFEPICNYDLHPGASQCVDFLVSISLRRRSSWESREEAEADFLATKNFSRWHPESIKAYVQGGIVPSSPENNIYDPTSKYVLSCHPRIEASLYCGRPLRLSVETMGTVRAPVTFQYGSRTQLFFPKYMEPAVQAFPHLYRVAEAVPDSTHALVLEDLDVVTERIIESLEELQVYGGAGRG